MGESKARNTEFSCPNIRIKERQSQTQMDLARYTRYEWAEQKSENKRIGALR